MPENTGKFNALLRHSLPLGKGPVAATALFYRNDWTATDQIPRRAVTSGALDRFGSLDDSTGGKTRRASLSLDYTQRSATQLFKASAYVVDYQLNLFSNFAYFLDHPVDGDQFEQADDRRYGGLTLAYERHGQFLGKHVHHRLGADLRRDEALHFGRLEGQAAATEAFLVGIAGVRADIDLALARPGERAEHRFRVACVAATSNVGTGHDV